MEIVETPGGHLKMADKPSEEELGISYNVKLASEVWESFPEKKAGYRGLAFYCFFLALYILIQMMQLDPETTFSVNSVFQTLVDGYKDVSSEGDLFDYIQKLTDSIFTDAWYNDDEFTAEDTGFVNYYNKLVGGVQIVQQRGVLQDCPAGLYQSFYGSCHSEVLDTSAFGEGGMFNYSESQQGHVLFLSVANNKKEVQAKLANYRTNRWLDKQTRMVSIKFAAYNGEIEVFTFVVITFNFGRAGIMNGRNIAEIQSASFELYKNTTDYVRLALELIWLYLVAWTAADEIIDFIQTVFIEKQGLSGYFSSLWNYLDMANLGLLFAYVAFRVRYVTFIFDHPIFLPSNKYEEDLEIAAEIQKKLLLINAFNIFEKIIHLFKFFQFQERMNILNQTMARAFSDLVHFFILFFLVFLGYASMTMILFGPHLVNYSTFGKTVESLGEIILGAFDFNSLFEIDPLMASISFWSFMLLVFFILVNVFLAIIIDSYADAKNQSQEAFSPGIDEDLMLWFREVMAVASSGDSKGKKKRNTKKVVGDALRYFTAKSLEKVTAKDLKWYMSNVLKCPEGTISQAMMIFDALPGRTEKEAVEIQLNALLKHYWNKADKDGSGYLDPEEFRAFLLDAPIKFHERDIEQIIRATDTNSDGKISYDEFIPVCHKIMLQSVRD